MKTKNIILSAILTLIITVISPFIISYFNAPIPLLHPLSDNWCSNSIDIENSDYHYFDIKLQNKGDGNAYAKICFKSKDLFFRIDNKLVNEICSEETSIPKPSNDLSQPFKINLEKLNDSTKEKLNLTIEINIECDQKIWSLINKKCDGKAYFCVYKKEGSYLRLHNILFSS